MLVSNEFTNKCCIVVREFLTFMYVKVVLLGKVQSFCFSDPFLMEMVFAFVLVFSLFWSVQALEGNYKVSILQG